MTKGKMSDAVVSERALWIRRMISALKALPLQRKQDFLDDPRNVAAAESYLRRALEALFDIGRHILAKGFALPTSEYKEISEGLREKEILSLEEKELRSDRKSFTKSALIIAMRSSPSWILS